MRCYRIFLEKYIPKYDFKGFLYKYFSKYDFIGFFKNTSQNTTLFFSIIILGEFISRRAYFSDQG